MCFIYVISRDMLDEWSLQVIVGKDYNLSFNNSMCSHASMNTGTLESPGESGPSFFYLALVWLNCFL